MAHKKGLGYVLAASVALAILLAGGTSEARIQRIDICDVHFQPSDAVPAIREVPTTVIVRGDLVDTHTSIEKNAHISVDVLGRSGGGGVNTSVALKITPRATLGTGHHAIKLHYLVELNGPDVFTINVPAPRVDSIGIQPSAPNYPTGTQVTITARGSGLTHAHLNSLFGPSQSALTDVHPQPTNANERDNVITFTAKVTRPIQLLSSSFTLTNIQLQDSCISNHAAGNFRLPINVTGARQVIPPIPKTCVPSATQTCP
jgi:hypothetical protein